MIVVLVLMSSCQVSENAKMGPQIAQMIIIKNAIMKVTGLPAVLVTAFENLSNHLFTFDFDFI